MRSAAAAPESTSAFTAATSPTNVTVTRPASARSVPSSRTSAAFKPASVASMAPTSPRVSMSPSAPWAQGSAGVTRGALGEDRLELGVWARNHVDGDELADSFCRGRAGVGRRLHRTHVAANHDSDVATADFLL